MSHECPSAGDCRRTVLICPLIGEHKRSRSACRPVPDPLGLGEVTHDGGSRLWWPRQVTDFTLAGSFRFGNERRSRIQAGSPAPIGRRRAMRYSICRHGDNDENQPENRGLGTHFQKRTECAHGSSEAG